MNDMSSLALRKINSDNSNLNLTQEEGHQTDHELSFGASIFLVDQ